MALAVKIFPDFSTDVSPAARALIFTLVLMAHGIALALASSIKTVGGNDKASDVLQVHWVANGQNLEAPATPTQEIAPGYLPMRARPVVSKSNPRSESGPRANPTQNPTQNPAQATNTDTPDPKSLSTEFSDRLAQTESRIASGIETASANQSEGAESASGARSGTASGALNGANQDFVEPVFEAAYLSNPRPEYPALSRRLSEQGMVILNIHVTAEGKADKVLLHQSCGFERLDKVASDVVWRWRFTPARQGGRNVAAWVLVPIRFTLRS